MEVSFFIRVYLHDMTESNEGLRKQLGALQIRFQKLEKKRTIVIQKIQALEEASRRKAKESQTDEVTFKVGDSPFEEPELHSFLHRRQCSRYQDYQYWRICITTNTRDKHNIVPRHFTTIEDKSGRAPGAMEHA